MLTGQGGGLGCGLSHAFSGKSDLVLVVVQMMKDGIGDGWVCPMRRSLETNAHRKLGTN